MVLVNCIEEHWNNYKNRVPVDERPPSKDENHTKGEEKPAEDANPKAKVE